MLYPLRRGCMMPTKKPKTENRSRVLSVRLWEENDADLKRLQAALAGTFAGRRVTEGDTIRWALRTARVLSRS